MKHSKAYLRGVKDYKAGVSFFFNPYFGHSKIKMRAWAKGWGDTQIAKGVV